MIVKKTVIVSDVVARRGGVVVTEIGRKGGIVVGRNGAVGLRIERDGNEADPHIGTGAASARVLSGTCD